MKSAVSLSVISLLAVGLAACSDQLLVPAGNTQASNTNPACGGMGNYATGTDNRALGTAETVEGEFVQNGKRFFRNAQFGLAEESFRKATENSQFGKDGQNPARTLEAWLGLAASYDKLKRFDLADPIYMQIQRQFGASLAYHNNYGYSLLLRGDKAGALRQFQLARKFGPDCGIIKNNITIASRA